MATEEIGEFKLAEIENRVIADRKRLKTSRITQAAEICLFNGEMTPEDYDKIKEKNGMFDKIESLWLDGVFSGCLLNLYSKNLPTIAEKIQIKVLNQGIDALQGRVR